LHYFDRQLPIEPTSSTSVLKGALDSETELVTDTEAEQDRRDRVEYRELVAALDALSPTSVCDPDHQRARQAITRRAGMQLASLAGRSPRIRTAIDQAVASYNGTPGEPDTFDRLDNLLDRQPYRVAHWKTAFDEINYRRFFDINDLGAIRME